MDWFTQKKGGLPWDKKQWRGGRIKPNIGTPVIQWIGAIIFIGICIPMFGAFDEIVGDGIWWQNGFSWLMILFLFIGLITLLYAILSSIRLFRFRNTRFLMDTIPGVIGGTMRGTLILPEGLRFENKIKVILLNEEKMVHHRSGTSDTGPDQSIEYLFRDIQTVDPAAAQHFGNRLEFPLSFTIPYETKDESESYSTRTKGARSWSRYYYRWALQIKANLPGPDLDLEFTLPIFRTSESDKTVTTIDIVPETVAELDQHLAAKLDERTIDIADSEIGRGQTFTTDKSSKPILLIIVLALNAATLFFGFRGIQALWRIISNGFNIDQISNNLFSLVVFGVICMGGALFAFLLTYWYLDSAPAKTITFADGRLQIRYALFGIFWTKEIPVDLISNFKVNKSGSYNGRPFYNVQLYHTMGAPWWMPKKWIPAANGQGGWDGTFPLTMASDMYNKEEANYLAQALTKEIKGRSRNS